MWIPITLAAATFQILRTSRTARTAVRAVGRCGRVRALPLRRALRTGAGRGVVRRCSPTICPTSRPRFWLDVALAGVSQIVATIALLRAFRERDFAIGTVYSKSEVIAVAVIGAIGLGEALQLAGLVRRRCS